VGEWFREARTVETEGGRKTGWPRGRLVGLGLVWVPTGNLITSRENLFCA